MAQCFRLRVFNVEVPGLIPGWDLPAAVFTLRKKLSLIASATQQLNRDILCCMHQGTAEEQPLADVDISLNTIIFCKLSSTTMNETNFK